MDGLVLAEDSGTTFALSLPSELGAEKLVRHTLAWILSRLKFGADRVADVQTAVSEACINAIEHGNDCRPGRRFNVVVSYTPEHVDTIVADEGVRPFDLPHEAPATIEQKLAGLAPFRGMGLLLIGQLVDECSFVPAQSGQGNRVHMRVYRPVSEPALPASA